MLTHLKIRGYAIIDALELEFGAGLTVVTGETGAGKSIVVDALGLLLGDRAESGVVRPGAERAELEAEFDLATLPVVAAWRIFERLGWTESIPGRLAATSAGLSASLLVTAVYHLGFAEFRGPGLAAPLLGNGIITIGYLLAGNPLTALVAHVVLHLASVVHGIDTTVTLPPHYS